MTKRLVPLLVLLTGIWFGVTLNHFTNRYAEAQGMATAPDLAMDAGPAPAATVTITAPATSDIAVTAPEPQTPAPVDPATLPPTKDAGSLAGDVYTSVKGGQWRLAIAGMIGLLMLGLAKVRDLPRSPFKGDRGGAALVLLLSLGTALTAALSSSAPLTPTLFLGALVTACTAAGGYSLVKRLFWPKAPG